MTQTKTQEYPVLWLQAATCTGCSVSVLNSVSPTIKNILIDEVIPGKHINLRYHATIMAGQGEAVIEVLEDTSQNKRGGYIGGDLIAWLLVDCWLDSIYQTVV